VVPDIEAPKAAVSPMSTASFKGSIAVIGPPWAHAEQVGALLALGLGWAYQDWRYLVKPSTLEDQVRGFCRTLTPLVWSLADPVSYQLTRDALRRHRGLLIVILPEADVVDHGASVWRDTISRAQARWMASDLVELASEHAGPVFGLRLPREDSVDANNAINRDAVADATMILACEAALTLSRVLGFPSTRAMFGWVGNIARERPLSGLCLLHVPDHVEMFAGRPGVGARRSR
jgi:hypothetical protein